MVPAGFSDAAVSSLGNSSPSSISAGSSEEAARILDGLPEMQRQAARRVRDMLRGPTEVAPEHWADYLALAAGDPRSGDDGSGAVARWDDPRCRPGLPEQVAREPRLRDEGRSFETSARPASERLDDIGFINGDVRTELLDFLADRRLQDSRRWLQELADERYQGLTSNRWELEAHSGGDLESTDVLPC